MFKYLRTLKNCSSRYNQRLLFSFSRRTFFFPSFLRFVSEHHVLVVSLYRILKQWRRWVNNAEGRLYRTLPSVNCTRSRTPMLSAERREWLRLCAFAQKEGKKTRSQNEWIFMEASCICCCFRFNFPFSAFSSVLRSVFRYRCACISMKNLSCFGDVSFFSFVRRVVPPTFATG